MQLGCTSSTEQAEEATRRADHQLELARLRAARSWFILYEDTRASSLCLARSFTFALASISGQILFIGMGAWKHIELAPPCLFKGESHILMGCICMPCINRVSLPPQCRVTR